MISTAMRYAMENASLRQERDVYRTRPSASIEAPLGATCLEDWKKYFAPTELHS